MMSTVKTAAAAALALALPLVAAGCARKGDDAATRAAPPQAVTVATVRRAEVNGGLTASGRILPREEVAAAADLNGYRIARVLVDEGQRVRAGQPLAVLDDSLLATQIRQVRAQLAQQQVSVEQAREQAARVRGLDDQGVLSNEAIATRRYARRNAEAGAGVTRAQLDDLLTRQAHMVIRAPAAGLVLSRSARPGDPSSSGTTLFTIARDSLLELYAEMPETALAEVHVGDPVDVALPSGRVLQGHVRLIGARVADTTGTVIVRIALPVDPELRQGGFARARFAGRRSIVAVPEAAVRFDADGASVMEVDGQSRVHRRAVRTGIHSQGLVELQAGPPPGTRVAVKGAAFTLEGDKVTVTGREK